MAIRLACDISLPPQRVNVQGLPGVLGRFGKPSFVSGVSLPKTSFCLAKSRFTCIFNNFVCLSHNQNFRDQNLILNRSNQDWYTRFAIQKQF